MMKITALLAAAASFTSVSALAQGQATTTHYANSPPATGACGCGTGNNPFQFMSSGKVADNIYIAAASPSLYDPTGEKTWCGNGCGTCYKLTTTGSAPAGSAGGPAGKSITVMVGDLCPGGGGAWCPVKGQMSSYNSEYHFDILNEAENPLGENPIVTYEKIDCPGQAASDYGQCTCKGGASYERRSFQA